MPYEIDLGMPPAGFCVKSAREGEEVLVQVLGFSSTEDGQEFVRKLESFPTHVIDRIPGKRVLPSQVDTLVAIIRRDGKATVYLNELSQRGQVRVSRAIKAGEGIFKNDIVDVGRVELGIDIPGDCGFLYVFSIGWRKGMYFDFGPVAGPDPQPRSYDICDVLGRAHAHVMFQERFSISEDEWRALFLSKWFPFAGLPNETIEKMLEYVRAGWSVDELLSTIVTQVKSRLRGMVDSWKRQPLFAKHFSFLETAARHFESSDYLSCTSILFPRIEGILRANHARSGGEAHPSQKNLPKSAVAGMTSNPKSLLLPHKFESYLSEIYFADFDPNKEAIDVGRNSVSHGVASVESFNEKSAAIAILIVHQLFYCFANTDQVSVEHGD